MTTIIPSIFVLIIFLSFSINNYEQDMTEVVYRENDRLDKFEREIYGQQTLYKIFFFFIFTNFLFVSIIYHRSTFF